MIVVVVDVIVVVVVAFVILVIDIVTYSFCNRVTNVRQSPSGDVWLTAGRDGNIFMFYFNRQFQFNFPDEPPKEGALYFCLSVCLSLCLSVSLSVCLSLCFSLSLSLCLSCQSVISGILSVHPTRREEDIHRRNHCG